MINKINKNKIILHIDMNSYFASVEQQANPFLRGKSVGVCAYLSPGGAIIASSIEAKAKGIKTGCRVRDAKILDPNVVLLENEPTKYRTVTQKIFDIFKEYTDKVEPYSIDEAFLDLTGWVHNFNEANKKAKEIQKRIKNEIGEWLTCSIGISWTRFLAKFAGDIAAKKSIVSINDESKLIAILKGRSLIDAWGINIRMEERLKAIGINNMLDLKNYNPNHIKKRLGRYGYYLWANVNGIEISDISSGVREPKSIGHSYCIPKKTRDKNYLSNIFYKLCEKTGRRLRSSNHEAFCIHIAIAYTRGGGVHKSFKLPEKIYTTDEIFNHVSSFLKKANLIMPARMLAVSVSRLSPVTNQMSLFENNLNTKELSKAIDIINDKYGEFTLIKGRMFDMSNIARDRIGFRKIN